MPLTAALDRIPRRPLSTVVFDQLLDRIVGGVFAPGQSLPSERRLCSELGVSRTAVREALARLAQLRLIAIRHGGETLVLDFRVTAGLDLLPYALRRSNKAFKALLRSGFEMRAVLGPDVARLAAKRRTEAVITELDDVVAAMKSTRELGELSELSLRFWGALAAASENLAYQLAFNSLRQVLYELPEIAAAQARELRNLRGYRAIAEAVRRRESTSAARAAHAHISLGLAGLMTITAHRGAP